MKQVFVIVAVGSDGAIGLIEHEPELDSKPWEYFIAGTKQFASHDEAYMYAVNPNNCVSQNHVIVPLTV